MHAQCLCVWALTSEADVAPGVVWTRTSLWVGALGGRSAPRRLKASLEDIQGGHARGGQAQVGQARGLIL